MSDDLYQLEKKESEFGQKSVIIQDFNGATQLDSY